jgi:uncharacterized protein YdcH (DUF465 family)
MAQLTLDAAIAKLRKRRQNLTDEIQRIDTALVALATITELPSDELEADLAENSAASDTTKTAYRTTGARSAGIAQKDFVPMARPIFVEHGRPMTLSEILDGFHKRGRVIGGSDEMSNLKSKLWRAKDEIIKLPGAGYWLKAVPCAEVDYTPPDTGRIARPSFGGLTS